MTMQIWHNPRCTKSRQAMKLLEEHDIEPTVRKYLNDPPTADELREVLAQLDMQPWELVRMREKEAKELDLKNWDRDDPDRWIEAMVAHPRLIERPVVIAEDGRAVVGRPTEKVEDLL